MNVILKTMSSLSTVEKILQIDLFLIGISTCVLVVIILCMFFVSDSRIYSQLLSALKLFCFILAFSLISLALGYVFVDTFAEQVKVYLML